MRRLDPPQLRDRDLEVAQQLEQHRLELLVGLVDLVDQQHDRLLRGDRLHQRAGEQELRAEDVVLDGVPAGVVAALGLDPQQLLAVVPLVERLGLVEALVALQAHERAAEVARERLRQLGLADARRALDEDRLAQPRGQVGDQGGGFAGQVAGLAQAGGDLLGGLRLLACSRRRSLVRCSILARVDETSPTPFVALMALGFLIGCAGHLYKSPATVAVGIAIAFLAIGGGLRRSTSRSHSDRVAACA